MKGLFTPHKLTYCTTHQSILQQIYIGLMGRYLIRQPLRLQDSWVFLLPTPLRTERILVLRVLLSGRSLPRNQG